MNYRDRGSRIMCPSGGGSLTTGTYVLRGGKLHWKKQYRGTNSAAANLLIKNNRTGGDGTNSCGTNCTNIIQTTSS